MKKELKKFLFPIILILVIFFTIVSGQTLFNEGYHFISYFHALIGGFVSYYLFVDYFKEEDLK